MTRKPFAPLLIALALLASGPVRADSVDALYQAHTIVTGQREPERLAGFAHCIEDALVKVSGDPRLVGDPRLEPMKVEAAQLVKQFRYHDRKEGIPIHDEQGTRDRPYDLFVTFDRFRIDAMLASLGETPWTATRPRLAVFLGVRHGPLVYVLARDGPLGVDQRESLAAAADKLGLEVVLPSAAMISARRVTFRGLAGAGLPHPDALARTTGGDIALVGTLVWNDKALKWIAEWRLARHRRVWRWRIQGVSFDAAFRNGVGGAEQILSGHGAPK